MDNNIYYEPEAFGLEIWREFDVSSRSYEFNAFVIWRRKEGGRLFYATDSGCSCPSPFENERPSTLKPISERTYETFKSDFESFNNQEYIERPVSADEKIRLFADVLREVKS